MHLVFDPTPRPVTFDRDGPLYPADPPPEPQQPALATPPARKIPPQQPRFFVIGDVHGHLTELIRLFERVHFDPKRDRALFLGDLVGRGPWSAHVVRFVRDMGSSVATCLLGNHELALIKAALRGDRAGRAHVQRVLNHASDANELVAWLRHQPLLAEISVSGHTWACVHAGLHPLRDLAWHRDLARHAEMILQGDDARALHALSEQDTNWESDCGPLGQARDILTRMRYVYGEGFLDYTATQRDAPPDTKPWFAWDDALWKPDVKGGGCVFGHWSALRGECPAQGVYHLDGGVGRAHGRLLALEIGDVKPHAIRRVSHTKHTPSRRMLTQHTPRFPRVRRGDVYLVGGHVRDLLLGMPPRSQHPDWVAVGTSEKDMFALGYKRMSPKMPVFQSPEGEIALARKEHKLSDGHRGFSFDIGPDITLEDDLKRRDLTIHSMAVAKDGTLIDPLGGLTDLSRRILRHNTPAFIEDPLRLYRTLRTWCLLMRHGFRLDPRTHDLLRAILSNADDLQSLATALIAREAQTARTGSWADLWAYALFDMGLPTKCGPTLGAYAARAPFDRRHLASLRWCHPGITIPLVPRKHAALLEAQRIWHHPIHGTLPVPAVRDWLARTDLDDPGLTKDMPDCDARPWVATAKAMQAQDEAERITATAARLAAVFQRQPPV